jgi:hypothetical protein
MKQLTLIILSLLLNLFVNGQTLQDKQNVIQKSIDLELLQSYFTDIEFEGKQQLFIVDNGIVPSSLELLKYGNKVTFMSKEEMFFKDIRNHIDFSNFTIDSESADIKFRYGISGPSFHLEFIKDRVDWKITKSDLIE